MKLAAVAGAAAALGVSSVAMAQTRTINPIRTFTVGPTEISSTYAIQPQIQPNPPYVVHDIAAENDNTPPLPLELGNNLVPGGLLGGSRGAGQAYFPGPFDGRYVPPDCNMAVGPNYVVCTINATIAFFRKDGTRVFQSQLDGPSGFFNGTAQTTFVFDPRCMYDPISQRFFVLADDLNETSSIGNVLLAVSATNNPNGVWYKYRINSVLTTGGASYWSDYPTLGFNKDAVVITGNMFGFTGGYYGVEALVLKKTPLLTGGTAQVTVLTDPGVGTLQPMRTTDATLNKVFGVAQGGGNAVRFYAITNPGTSPVLKEIDVPVPAYSPPPGGAPSGGNTIATLDGRIMSCNYRNSQVVAAHTISINGGIGVRWYDFNVNTWPTSGTPTVKQSGNITQSGAALHMPAININTFEDISVVYTRSSTSIPADVCFSGRFRTDATGQIGQPVRLAGSPSNGNYQSFRWGDYFGNEIDPADDTTFWGLGMTVLANGNYQTEVVKWTVTPPGGNAYGNPVSASAVSTFQGNYIFGDVSSISAIDGIYYEIGSSGIPQFGQAAGAEADFTVPTTSTSMTVDFAANGGVSGGTNMVFAYNWLTTQFDLIGSIPMAASGSTERFMSFRATGLANYIGPGGSVRVELRGHLPIRPFNNNMPNPFTYRIDLLQLRVR